MPTIEKTNTPEAGSPGVVAEAARNAANPIFTSLSALMCDHESGEVEESLMLMLELATSSPRWVGVSEHTREVMQDAAIRITAVLSAERDNLRAAINNGGRP